MNSVLLLLASEDRGEEGVWMLTHVDRGHVSA